MLSQEPLQNKVKRSVYGCVLTYSLSDPYSLWTSYRFLFYIFSHKFIAWRTKFFITGSKIAYSLHFKVYSSYRHIYTVVNFHLDN